MPEGAEDPPDGEPLLLPPDDGGLPELPPEEELGADELLSPPLDGADPSEGELPEAGEELVDPAPEEGVEPAELPLLGDDDDAEVDVAADVETTPDELLPPLPPQATSPPMAIAGNNCRKLIELESQDMIDGPALVDLRRRKTLFWDLPRLSVRLIVRQLK